MLLSQSLSLLCLVITAAIKVQNKKCNKATGITILLDNTKHVTKDIHELETHLEKDILAKFQKVKLKFILGQYTNNQLCADDDALKIDDDAQTDTQGTYKMICVQQLLRNLQQLLKVDHKIIERYALNVAYSLSVSKWLPEYIQQRYAANITYLVLYLNSSTYAQKIFTIEILKDDQGKYSFDNDEKMDVLLTMMQNICPRYFPPIVRTTTTPATTAAMTISKTTSPSNSQTYVKYRTDAATILTTKSSISGVATTPSATIERELKKEINKFLTQNITEKQLSNFSWTHDFLNTSSKLLNRIDMEDDSKDSEVRSEKVLEFIEKTLLKVGSELSDGNPYLFVTDSLVAEVSSVKKQDYEGYTFPQLNETSQQSSLSLPTTLLNNSTTDKVSIVAMKYKPLKMMRKVRNHFNIADDVISVSLDPPVNTPFVNLLNFTMRRIKNNLSNHHCVFWNTRRSEWDSFGCEVAQITDDDVTCQCNHMTSFSVLMQVEEFQISGEHQFALMIITYIGCGVSIASCICLIIIYVFLRRMLKIDRNIIHVNLAVAIAISNALFLSADSAIDKPDICLGISISMLYFYLATFFWMLVEGIHVYLMIFEVFKSRKRMTWYLLIGWAPPVVITTFTALQYKISMTTEDFCWLSTEKGVIWAFVGPALFVISINTIILCMTLKTSQKIKIGGQEVRELRRIARLTLVLMPIFGISWIFGIFAINRQTVVFQYVFTTLNVLQGLFIFIGYGIMNNEVRREASKRKRLSESADIRHSTSTTKSKRYNAVFCNRAFSSTNERNHVSNGDIIRSTTSHDIDDVFTDSSSVPYSISDELYRNSVASSNGAWMYGDLQNSPAQNSLYLQNSPERNSLYSLNDESYRSTKFLTSGVIKV